MLPAHWTSSRPLLGTLSCTSTGSYHRLQDLARHSSFSSARWRRLARILSIHGRWSSRFSPLPLHLPGYRTLDLTENFFHQSSASDWGQILSFLVRYIVREHDFGIWEGFFTSTLKSIRGGGVTVRVLASRSQRGMYPCPRVSFLILSNPGLQAIF